MTSFKEIFDLHTRSYQGDQTQILLAHTLLTAFSSTHRDYSDPNYRDLAEKAEAASLAVMLRSAEDLVKPRRIKLLSHRDDDLKLPSIRLAGISTNHNCIASVNEVESENHRGHTLRMASHVSDGCELRYSEHNDDADPHAQYDYQAWKKARLEPLKRCVNEGAQIIALGEFDYPPQFNDDDDRDFDDSILRIIEEADQEVFIVAGSRHEFQRKGGQVVAAWNRAKIYANSKLANLDRAKDSPIVFPINQEKIVSAQKAGEYINVPTPSRISYYESKIGRIGVLICVDAYSPNVIFSLLNQRDMGSPEKLDYILVPAFNMSRKLYYACQVLSLTCQTVVMLVDACKYSRRKKTRLALFVGGRVFSDVQSDPTSDVSQSIGQVLTDPADADVRVWELNRKQVIEQQQLVRTENNPLVPGSRPSFFAQTDFFRELIT